MCAQDGRREWGRLCYIVRTPYTYIYDLNINYNIVRLSIFRQLLTSCERYYFYFFFKKFMSWITFALLVRIPSSTSPPVAIRSALPDSENRKCIYRAGFSKARRTGKNEHAGKEEFVRISRLHASFVTGDSVNCRSGYGTRRCIYTYMNNRYNIGDISLILSMCGVLVLVVIVVVSWKANGPKTQFVTRAVC